MRRRLTLALVATALGAIALVAIGVLVTARIGARSEAEHDITERLESLAELIDADRGRGAIGRTLARTRQAFDVQSLRLVAVDDATGIATEARPGPDQGQGGAGNLGAELAQLDRDQLAAYRSGEVVILEGTRSVAQGMRVVDGTDFGLLLAEDVGRIPSSVTTWFLVSAAVVLAAATALATWMSGRFVAPIRAIENTTEALASGQLDARVPPSGGPEELVQLAASVNSMADDLQRSRAAEQQFLLSVSHDLRTPLAVITGYAEGLADGAFEDPAATGTVIESHARRLGRLVDDLLDLAKLDTNQFSMRPQTIDVAVAAGRIVAGLQGRAVGDGVALNFDGTHAAAMVDPDRIDQVIGNLVDNGLKFASTEVRVVVGADPVPTVTVADDGPGIPQADQPFVFDRLYQSAAAPRRAENASGMGLAIVKQLVEAMDGSVSLQSSPAGTAITVTLPPGQATSSQSAKSADQPGR